jgi:hypothetical protein
VSLVSGTDVATSDPVSVMLELNVSGSTVVSLELDVSVVPGPELVGLVVVDADTPVSPPVVVASSVVDVVLSPHAGPASAATSIKGKLRMPRLSPATRLSATT